MIEKEKGCVYFFRHIGLSPVKIGYSTNESPINRFDSFKTYAPYGSEILGFIQTDEAKIIETKLHLKYANKRLLGEWFEITENEVKSEIDFYSNIEDIKNRNDFQVAWAKELNYKKNKIENIIYNSKHDAKTAFVKMYLKKPNLNKSSIAKELGVTRQAVHKWIREITKNGI
jgi:hypothetical protein